MCIIVFGENSKIYNPTLTKSFALTQNTDTKIKIN